MALIINEWFWSWKASVRVDKESILSPIFLSAFISLASAGSVFVNSLFTSQGHTFRVARRSESFFWCGGRRVDVSRRELNERRKTRARLCCTGTREVRGGVESWLVLRGSSEGDACCNGLLQIDWEIRTLYTVTVSCTMRAAASQYRRAHCNTYSQDHCTWHWFGKDQIKKPLRVEAYEEARNSNSNIHMKKRCLFDAAAFGMLYLCRLMCQMSWDTTVKVTWRLQTLMRWWADAALRRWLETRLGFVCGLFNWSHHEVDACCMVRKRDLWRNLMPYYGSVLRCFHYSRLQISHVHLSYFENDPLRLWWPEFRKAWV